MAGSFFFYYFRNRPLLQNGLVRPTHVDVHPEKACNGPCAHCIGKSDSQAKRVEKRLNRGNIAGVLDRVITPDHVPYLHIAGFTGDCLVKSDYQEDRPTIPWATNTTVEGIIHLLKKGLAPKVSLLTNGLGFHGWEDDFGFRKEVNYDFIVFLPLIGSVQINLNAAYNPDLSFADFQSRQFDQVMATLRKLVYYRGWAKGPDEYYPAAYLARLGISDKLPIPMEIVGNFTLTPANYHCLPDLLKELRFNELKTEMSRLDQSLIPPYETFTYPIDELRLRVDLNNRDIGFHGQMLALVEKLKAQYAGEGLKVTMKSPLDPRRLETLDRCLAPFFWPAVGPDAQVYPCAHTVSPEFALGSLFEQTLEQILQGYFLSNKWKTAPQCKRLCPSTVGNINLLGQSLQQEERVIVAA
ncbi:hypothetical protein A2291_05300 [candidate division WOR-1 bacterium RIFOXYB2_FULL_42_35]|uniref:4Fe4S-binding SPASM domain-containing protein n=1 Tax=candidate division WOR-1 bacterium RIFOXYC2_FULL_41_25 TaxID=1802586 RepID=A0A1F4TN30_UNCSA|nr:MAG: hypothetical protein A2247_00720 [candidate division WOR-1 bacterium RIFOXYA2_FULL_41_14]OGC24516.1 MAG: hypothetical protein A2291_05300 [candidate division WOR-1 bacterium RIFOXYB2_FULL_42_35]OGC34132.1 MAG: hypothetical protein A2462_01160 [candidate division WOR-1 bacterium RIFOXYC2_FULL_41_25]